MTLRTTPMAIDGSFIDAAMLRTGLFASTSGSPGVVNKGAMKVTQLDSAGNGFKIAAGSAVVVNHYQANPSQSYVVTDIAGTTFGSGGMPAENASARSHLVCVTIGDPEFSQVGHPWMEDTDPPEDEALTFEYTRYFVVQNVPSGTNSFEDLGLNFPAYALARIDIPSHTTAITNAMIHDLRGLARPRTKEVLAHISASGANELNGGGTPGDWESWPLTVFIDVPIPDWAVRAYITGFVEGAKLTAAGSGRLRIAFDDGGSTNVTNIEETATSGRRSYNVGGEIAIPAEYRGTTRRLRMQGTVDDEDSLGFETTDTKTSGQIRILLVEEVV